MSTDLFLMAIFFPCISFFSFFFYLESAQTYMNMNILKKSPTFLSSSSTICLASKSKQEVWDSKSKIHFYTQDKEYTRNSQKTECSEREHFSRWESFSAAAAALSEVLKSSPCSRPPGMRLWILAETPTRASWENRPSIHTLVPSSNSTLQVLSDHRRISTAVCIRRRGTEAEKARADYQLAFDLSLALHVGIYEFHCRRFFFVFFLHTSLFALHKSIHLSEQLTSLELDRSLALRR